LPRTVALQVSTAPEHSPRARAKDIEGRIVWLHVVQHVGEVKINRPRGLYCCRNALQLKVQTQTLHLQWIKGGVNPPEL
jgi:hypothetical protein